MNSGKPTFEPRQIVESERAVGQVEGLRLRAELLQIRFEIGHCRVARLRMSPRQHPLGKLDAQDARRALPGCPAAEPAKTAAKIEHALAAQFRQEAAQRIPLGGDVKTVDRAWSWL